MNRTQRIILYLLLLITGASWLVLSADPDGNPAARLPAPQPGYPAPDFTLKTAEGETYTLSALKGQAVLVNMWATWCPPCEAEMPAIEKVYNEYKDFGFVVLAVNNTFQDNPFDIAPFVTKHGLTFPILLDETADTARAYQVRSLPSSYFINRQGIIIKVISGQVTETLLRIQIEEALQ